MNDFLFRALTAYTREWVYGYPIRGVCNTQNLWMMYIPAANPGEYAHAVFIDETTLGMWTGLRDENGKRIFEGDIVLGSLRVKLAVKGVVSFQDGAFGLWWNRGKVREFSAFTSIYNVTYEVIGNVHDNPELLEEENNETD